MKKGHLLSIAAVITALASTPTFASSNDSDDYKGKHKERYKEHMQKRHNMNMNMMEMLKETMTILRDLNHKPTADEKRLLSNMIDQMNNMMNDQREMGEQAMKRMDKYMSDDGYKHDKDRHHERRHD